MLRYVAGETASQNLRRFFKRVGNGHDKAYYL